MSKAKFTKGPWHVNRTGVHCNNPNLENIEVCYGEVDECVCDTVYEEADANLIACAPEMYNMLLLLLDEYAISDRDHDYTDEVEELLAKARGET